ncbi:hypothetical protein QEH56_02700 [Pelagicoccus enzymogenes]|uniref:TonB-dependent receptor plug domain-containing protein n=1 Tax=Pelagicoccus enzymogenes TaxID=2773457 RepID=UPI00280ED7FE|nr:TonB-dependent receptor plug domain-containing protein [Pelagicoccus enzymogenes]MDQ8197037.1 hypothetical protein [Pelagicoccus enzymogenes]
MIFYRCHRNAWLICVMLALTWTCILRANSNEFFFDVEAGPAGETLKVAALQANVEILISVGTSSEVVTNPIRGRFQVAQALAKMLDGTPLTAVSVSDGRAFGILKRGGGGAASEPGGADVETESKPQNEAQGDRRKLNRFLRGVLAIAVPDARTPASLASRIEDADIYELSPFEVSSSDNDIGYYSENTLAGSRLNSNISDLASSITVVTSRQLEDTAAVDINDVFLYEANTEGLGNYTSYEIDKDGAVRDNPAGWSNGLVANGPSTVNRVRGIAPADTARDYFPSIARIPFDTYNTRSVEINRGPNSILFGLGSAAGIVNQSLEKAVVGAESGEVKVRWGSWDDFRASGSFNRTLVEDVLAVNVSVLREEKGFRRKPSYDETKRQYLALTYKPSDNTTFRGTFENYENKNRRPNNVTPRDLITPWKAAGSPTWNPTTRRYALNGQVFGPVDSDSDLPSGLAARAFGPVFHFDQGEFLGGTQRSLGNAPGLVAGGTVYRMMKTNGENLDPLFIYPGVSDSDSYDWEHLNILSSNVGSSAAKIETFEWDQRILSNLYLNIGYIDESYEAENSYFIGQQTGATIEIDPNTHLLDGSPNPYFGRPFIEIREPDDFDQFENNSSFRATLAYELDFDNSDGWMRSLGRHRAMALVSSREYDSAFYRWRQVVLSDNPWVNQRRRIGGVGGAVYKRMYLGGQDGLVVNDPGYVFNGAESVTMSVGYPTSVVASDASLDSFAWEEETVDLGRTLHIVSSGEQQETDSLAFVLQSSFLKEKVVTTLGLREDRNLGRQGLNPEIDPETGIADPSDVAKEFEDWQRVSGMTSTAGIVLKPMEWLNFHYNESDNFTPAGVVYDIGTGEPLPLPTGEGRDWGMGLHLFDGKLYAKLNFFDVAQLNSRVGGTGTSIWRMGYFDEDFFGDWARYAASAEGLTGAAAEARVAEITQFPENFATYNNSVLGTSTLKGEGIEFQMVFNPSRNWNFKFNLAQQKTVFSEIAPEYTAWKAVRLPVWQAAYSEALPEGFQRFWDYDNDKAPFDIGAKRNVLHGTLNTPEKWFEINIDANMGLQQTLSGKKTSGQREWRWNAISNYLITDGALKGLGIGGSVRWEDSAIIGYLAGLPDEDGIVRKLDADKPVYNSEDFHVDFWASYTIPAFKDKLELKFQLNIRDAFESGGLEAIAVNPDGEESAFRIIDPRQFYFTTTLSF